MQKSMGTTQAVIMWACTECMEGGNCGGDCVESSTCSFLCVRCGTRMWFTGGVPWFMEKEIECHKCGKIQDYLYK
jgi:hypothetical protein